MKVCEGVCVVCVAYLQRNHDLFRPMEAVVMVVACSYTAELLGCNKAS